MYTTYESFIPKHNKVPKRRKGERGFTLLTAALCIVVLIGMVGLAVDIGRMYIAKSEVQVFTDSASLAATMELDGTYGGIDRALARVDSNPNLWNFQTSSFASVQTAFAKSLDGEWTDYPSSPAGYRYARVHASVEVPVYFMSLFMNPKVSTGGAGFLAVAPSTYTTSVDGDSSGAQEIKRSFREGIFPFSPYAHNNTEPHFGLVPGQLYTLRWAANPRLNDNVCPGDNLQDMIDLSEAGGGSERGYIEETSASIIRQAIVDDYQTTWRGIGDAVNMTGGAKNTERAAIIERVRQDSDSWAETYEEYVENGIGSGRRIVAAPINAGYPSYIVKQIGAFFLLRGDDYEQGGNKPWCAEYLGPWVQGSSHKGAGEGAGAYVVRLTE